MSTSQIRSAERTLSAGTWSITFGAILYSVLTVTPLVRSVTPNGWESTAPVLPLVVDAAVVIVVRLDSTVARLGASAGPWPTVLRWLTGVMTLALNVGDSALRGDLVGVAVHAVAPTLLIVTAEAGLAYRRAIAAALERIDREQREQAQREQAEREDQARLAREEREREREAAERREREAREHAAQVEQQRADREAAERREQREHEERLRRLDAERAEREQREQREFELAREERERTDRERREQQQRQQRQQREQRKHQRSVHERAEHTAHERQQRSSVEGKPPSPKSGRRPAKLSEEEALEAIRTADADDTVRELAELTGWSVGWVSARMRELQTVA
ncbi:DUF2637 domain-containing protein [Streptomyces sp. B15]|uniref:DUF2637 domain-containing protein n=1 Tax=Streptomyces sp. B15 TaxID=1537797 RepID=UPI001B378095|nr:DUF2637 domain-containing protein [Streptomyces sp. B15]MBQ1118590.1 DUF2637 domain-containing protein [Streptomyces sp. B15]